MFFKVLLLCAFLAITEAVVHRRPHHNFGSHHNSGGHHGSLQARLNGGRRVMHTGPHTGQANPRMQGQRNMNGRNPFNSQRRMPANEQEITGFLQLQIERLFEVGKMINANSASVCRWNYAKLTDTQKQTCSCLALFGFLNDRSGDPYAKGYSIFLMVWDAFSQQGGASGACQSRSYNSPRELHHVCMCMTGVPFL